METEMAKGSCAEAPAHRCPREPQRKIPGPLWAVRIARLRATHTRRSQGRDQRMKRPQSQSAWRFQTFSRFFDRDLLDVYLLSRNGLLAAGARNGRNRDD